jgi:hypothetical protein
MTVESRVNYAKTARTRFRGKALTGRIAKLTDLADLLRSDVFVVRVMQGVARFIRRRSFETRILVILHQLILFFILGGFASPSFPASLSFLRGG